MFKQVLTVCAFLLALCSGGRAHAQDAGTDVAGQTPTSTWRVDVTLPRVGLAMVARAEGETNVAVIADVEVRAAHMSGHGFAVRAAAAAGGTDYVPLIDVDYLYRVSLVGDAQLGLALDITSGLSGGHGDDRMCLFGCSDGAAVDGLRLGGNAGATLSFHAYGFVVDFDLRYRFLVPTGAAQIHEIIEPEHALSAGLGLGFGFW